MNEYYSIHYAARDFKILEQRISFSGEVVEAKPLKINFAYIVTELKDPDMGRLVAEKMANEVAGLMNKAYLQGWDDCTSSVENYFEEEKRNWIADNA